ncbi:hypothetical protein HDA40_002213 [Hamadaea flava]|uniref:Uncharacterized protein n=1 Tax=Hamadaea flava TaxID=1742688 RepID=A0ABV8LLU3_9ACTN|nr:hypothetical protein [Hamadaea flava]MCP2323706.1 hypothetical protein [Hamadaea flava]
MTTTVWPIGHYLGEYPADGTMDGGHHVRLGSRTIVLSTAEIAAWSAAAGTEHDPADPLLKARGLIAVVAIESSVAFADRHRLRPQLSAIGHPLGDAEPRFAIGVGATATALVDPVLREIWRWCGATRTLWTLCRKLHPDAPERVLAHFLLHGRELIQGGAAYLDVA